MATSLQNYVTQRRAQRARPAPPPPARRTTAQPTLPTARRPARNTMAPPVPAPAVNTMSPPVPRPMAPPAAAPPTGMAQSAPVVSPGQMAPPPAPGQQAPAAPPSLFAEPLAAEFAPPPNPMQPAPVVQRQAAPDQINYPGQNFGPSDLSLPVPQQQSTQMEQLMQIMPADFRAQITPAQLAALTPEQITAAIAKFSQPPTPTFDRNAVMPPGYRAQGPVAPEMSNFTGQGQLYGQGRSNPLSM